MSTKRRLTLLGFAAAMGLGVLAMGAQPASADPPPHAKAWGWRNKQSGYDRERGSYRYRNSHRYDRYDRYDRRDDRRYDRRDDWRHSGNDIDGDGIPNSRDRDIDGDGHPNWRDNKPYGSGYDYDRGSNYRRRRR